MRRRRDDPPESNLSKLLGLRPQLSGVNHADAAEFRGRAISENLEMANSLAERRFQTKRPRSKSCGHHVFSCWWSDAPFAVRQCGGARGAKMKAILGWTMLLREDVRQAELTLANEEQETRDEVGFLLLQQGFADRFFPGTSVQHTRLRYAFFVCWIYREAVFARRRGRSAEEMVRILFIELAIRLKRLGKETHGVIGGRVLGRLTSQPPDGAYWTALRTWHLLTERVCLGERLLGDSSCSVRDSGLRDDDGGLLNGDSDTEVFGALLAPQKDWSDSAEAAQFSHEQRRTAISSR